jgi:hypothetical protein
MGRLSTETFFYILGKRASFGLALKVAEYIEYVLFKEPNSEASLLNSFSRPQKCLRLVNIRAQLSSRLGTKLAPM